MVDGSIVVMPFDFCTKVISPPRLSLHHGYLYWIDQYWKLTYRTLMD